MDTETNPARLDDARADLRYATRNMEAQRAALRADIDRGAPSSDLLHRVGRLFEIELELAAAEATVRALE